MLHKSCRPSSYFKKKLPRSYRNGCGPVNPFLASWSRRVGDAFFFFSRQCMSACFPFLSALSPSNSSLKRRTSFSPPDNAKYVIRVTPMLNMNGSILNSTFTGNGGSKLVGQPNGVVTGGGGVIYIHNTQNFVQRRLYTRFKVSYFILDNVFTQNMGSFVVSAQLVLDSSVQSLSILYNRFRKNSIFKGPGNLNPRSSVHAVVLLSSGNVKCQRNEFANPNSHYEIGTQLESPSTDIDATVNFWGLANGDWAAKLKKVFGRIFSKIDRHTLAIIK